MNKEKGCGFREQEKPSNEPYIRPSKWYEGYVSK